MDTRTATASTHQTLRQWRYRTAVQAARALNAGTPRPTVRPLPQQRPAASPASG